MIEFTINKETYIIDEVTIRDYYQIQNLLVLNSTNAKLQIVHELSKCPIDLLKKLDKAQFIAVWNSLVENYLQFGKNHEFFLHFEFKGEIYAFLEMSQISIGEFADMEVLKVAPDANKNVHTMMALMYRPAFKARGKYKAEEYDPKTLNDRAELFLDLPMKYVYGALNFFLQVPRILLESTVDSLIKEKQTKEVKEILELTKQLIPELLETGTTSSYSSLEMIRPRLMQLHRLTQSLSSTSLHTERRKERRKKGNSLFSKLKKQFTK